MRYLACLATILAAPALAQGAAAGPLRAGAARADITPPAAMFPLTSGQTFGSVHDPLYVRALVLDDGARRAVLISADVTELPNGDELLGAVSAATHVPRERIVMSATHDHNAPTGGVEPGGRFTHPYFATLKAGIVAAARDAAAHLQPAAIGYRTGRAYVNTNRDEKIGAGYHMGYAPDGPSDKTVAVVTVRTTAGKPLAVYANYAVHGVVMYHVRSKDGQVQITGDLPGATAAYVEERLPGTVALWTSGAAGDQNPFFQGDYNQDAPDVVDEGAGAWALLDVQARRLGQEIVRVSQATQDMATQTMLWGAEKAVTCPGRQRVTPATPGTPNGGYLAPVDVAMIAGPPVVIPTMLLMIGDIAVAGVSAEVFTRIGEHLKRDAPFDRTMMVTLLPNRIGYIPTDEAYLLPSEKALTNRLAPGCAEPAMIAAFQGMMRDYRAWRGPAR